MKASIGLSAFLFVAAVLVALLQLWFVPWGIETFIKLEMTLGAFLLIVVVVTFLLKEYREDKATRSGNHLDD